MQKIIGGVLRAFGQEAHVLVSSELASKPIGHTHDNAEKAKAQYNHHDAHNAFMSYLDLGAR